MGILLSIVADLGVPNFYVLIPEIIVLTVALTILVLELFTKNKSLLSALSIFGLGLAAISVFFIQEGDKTLYGLYIVDTFSLWFKFLILITSITIFAVFNPYIDSKRSYYGEHYYLMLFSILGMMIMVSSPNLITMYMGLELMSISLYILVGLLKRDYKSKEGAFKYLIIGGAGTAIISYGIALIYGKTGTFDLIGIALKLQDNIDVGGIGGLVLLIVGLALKASAVPFHFWTPDAYEAAPTPITALMGGVAKLATYATIVRVTVDAFGGSSEVWAPAWAVLAAASMVVGNFIALRQKDVKRMLTYSSIAHTGYILAALASGNGVGFFAILFYAMVYVFMAIAGFLFLSAFERNEGWTNSVEDFKGLAKRHPIMALYMLILMFSMLGIPPTAGFMGKFGIFLSLISADVWWLTIVLVITSVISAGYYLRIVANMYMYEPISKAKFNLTQIEKAVIGFLSILTLLLGVYPAIFWEISNLLTNSLLMTAVAR
ncbi:MAG: NADH-quinone oxidoreductase subunit N [Hydrogenothermaceae bacterium]|nr:NADH-quinone oxidoreductase subunit N [Hydrogenothermaceae bacterium]